MFSTLLPRQADNEFKGIKAGLWLLALVLLLLAAMSTNSIFNGPYVATRADGLPLASYSPAAAQVILMFYAMWGVTQLTVVAFGFVALARYRSLVPLAFLLLLLEQAIWRVVHVAMPVAGHGGSGGSWFIDGLLAMTCVGFVLSLWRRDADPAHRSTGRPLP